MKKKVKQINTKTLEKSQKKLGKTFEPKRITWEWSLKDILPHEIKEEQRFSDLEKHTIKDFEISVLVEKLGEAVLLFLCNEIDAFSHTDSFKNISPLVPITLYELAIQTVYDYEKSRRVNTNYAQPKFIKKDPRLSYRTKSEASISKTKELYKTKKDIFIAFLESIDSKKNIPKKIKKYRVKK